MGFYPCLTYFCLHWEVHRSSNYSQDIHWCIIIWMIPVKEVTGRSQMYSAAGIVGGASLCFYQQKIHGNSLLLALTESLFIGSKMPWDIWTFAALQILTWILPSWEKIMKVKTLCFEGCYLSTYALKISLLTITFMTSAFSCVLIELILSITCVSSLYLMISSTT